MAKKSQSSHPIVHKVDYLMRVIAFFEDKLTSLEIKLLELQNQSKQPKSHVEKAVQVKGSVETKKQASLNLSEEKLIEIYNDIPNLLTAYAVTVALTPESYRQETQGKVLLEENKTGNYWIIHNNNTDLLLPNINLKMNIHKVRTVQQLFKFLGDNTLENKHYFLNKPAIVSLQSNGKIWQLESQGELEFINISLEKDTSQNKEYQRLLSLIKKLNYENTELRSTIEEINLRLNTFEKNTQK